MRPIYGRSPIIVLREPNVHERGYACNGCNAPNVTSILETGSTAGDFRGSTASVYRMCGECTRILKANVSAFPLPKRVT